MRVEAHIRLWPSDRRFHLPAVETRSMLFRFADEETMLGGLATSSEGIPFAPGTDHAAIIQFWADEPARKMVTTGAHFVVWYGDIGEGDVTAIE